MRGMGGGGFGRGMGLGKAGRAKRLDDVDQGHLRSSRQRFDAFRRQRKERRKDSDDDSEDRGSGMRRFLHWLAPFKRLIASVVVLGLITAGLDALWPILVGDMINAMNAQGGEMRVPFVAGWPAESVLLWLGIGSLVIILAARGVDLIRALCSVALSMQSSHLLRSQLFERFVRLPVGDLHDLKSGGVISRLSNDVDQTTDLANRGVIAPISAVLRLVVVVAVMLMFNWLITLISLVLLIGMALLHNMAMRHIRPIFRSMGKDRAGIDGRVAETFGGIRVVRSFAREAGEELAYGVGHHTVIRKQLFARLLMHSFGTFWGILMPLVGLLVVWIGGYYVLGGTLDLGAVLTMQILAMQALQPVMMIVDSMTQTQRGLASFDRIEEILQKQEEKPDRPEALPAPNTVADLVFENVWFAYGCEDGEDEPEQDDSERWALKGVDLHIPGGSTVALVGHSGAGKSTFADLVARFHDPSRGRITLDGVDLRDYRLLSHRQQLGAVQQDTFLFDGTIRDNIRYGNRDADDDAVRDAARRANAWEFIEPLEDGLDSIIGERGVKLSGGQRQRLAIARAILADPRILILDEATSNLDSESEQLIQASMAELLAGRTTIVIAHRLSTITHADLIVVLDHGRVVETGRHDDLMAQGGSYAAMIARQTAAAAADITLNA